MRTIWVLLALESGSFVPAILESVAAYLNSSILRKVQNTIFIPSPKAHSLIHLLIYSMSIGGTDLKGGETWVGFSSGTRFAYLGPQSLPPSGLKLKYYFCCVGGGVISKNSKNFTVRVSFICISSPISWYVISRPQRPPHATNRAVWRGSGRVAQERTHKQGAAGSHCASLDSLGHLLWFTTVQVSGGPGLDLTLDHTWVQPFHDSGFHFWSFHWLSVSHCWVLGIPPPTWDI